MCYGLYVLWLVCVYGVYGIHTKGTKHLFHRVEKKQCVHTCAVQLSICNILACSTGDTRAPGQLYSCIVGKCIGSVICTQCIYNSVYASYVCIPVHI